MCTLFLKFQNLRSLSFLTAFGSAHSEIIYSELDVFSYDFFGQLFNSSVVIKKRAVFDFRFCNVNNFPIPDGDFAATQGFYDMFTHDYNYC